jgi:hypothetical protein
VGNDISLKYIDDGKIVIFDTVFTENSRTIRDGIKTSIIHGLFCNSKESGQVLYLLNFSGRYDRDDPAIATVRNLIGSAQIVEEIKNELYPTGNATGYLFALLLIALAAFFFARNRRIQNSRNPLGKNSESFWRCPQCRLVNHIDHDKCRRCGAVRPQSESITK